MPGLRSLSAALLATLLAMPMVAAPAVAEGPDPLEFAKPRGGSGGGGGTRTPAYYPWMHSEVPLAWNQGWLGQRMTITVVDDFSSRNRYLGNLGDGLQRLRHGEWTRKEAGMIAPSSTMVAHDFYTGRAVSLTSGFDVLNLSYGMVDGQGLEAIEWDPQEASIIAAAHDNLAFVSKAAGNDSGTEIGQPNGSGIVDYLARDLIGAQGVVFVGALDGNGSADDKASLAAYSNVAGDTQYVDGAGQIQYVREQFLVVGVESGMTGLSGTSFAAPIISGYAAILESKFRTSRPDLIADQLLETARLDTISGYDPNIHGMGEASLSRALAPVSID